MSHELASGATRIASEPDSGSRLYTLQSKAMTQLAIGTCVVIASLLAVPDGVALIPQSTDLVSWILKVIGIWVSAAVLWFVGFLGILHCMSFLVKGVELNQDGIRLWRLARPIRWQHIDAVAMEPQYFFSKIFSLTPVAKKLTIFERKNSWRKGAEPHLVPHHLPSFLFAPADFERLLSDITRQKFDFEPSAPDVVVAEQSNFARLKSVYGLLAWQRVALSFLIAFGLVTLLGRKAIVNFQYNSGNKAMRVKDYVAAKERYETASMVDPTFAAAWNNLANAEFSLGDFRNAEKHWQRALFYKPDFVEAKVSLAYFALQKRDFATAKDLIDSALSLAPLNAAAIVTRADYAMRIGRVHDAINDARQVLADDPKRTGYTRYTAACILAQGRLRQDNPHEAQKILAQYAPVKDPLARDGTNISFRLLVTSAVDRALNKLEDAKIAIDTAVQRAPDSEEILIEKARVQIALGDIDGAATTLDAAKKINSKDPWVYIVRTELLNVSKKNPSQLAISRSVSEDNLSRLGISRSVSEDNLSRLGINRSVSEDNLSRLGINRSAGEDNLSRLGINKSAGEHTLAVSRPDMSGSQSLSAQLKLALSCPNQDAESLAQIAKLYEQIGDLQSAHLAAAQAAKIESNNPVALKVLRYLRSTSAVYQKENKSGTD